MAYRELSSGSDQQLTMATDTKLCKALASEGAEPSQSYRFKREAMRRNLPDCTPVTLYCNRQLGLKMGTPAYTRCGVKVAEMQAAKEAEERRIANENRQRELDREAWLAAQNKNAAPTQQCSTVNINGQPYTNCNNAQQAPMTGTTGPMNSNPVPVSTMIQNPQNASSCTSVTINGKQYGSC